MSEPPSLGAKFDGVIGSVRVNEAVRGFVAGGGFDVVFDFKTSKFWVGLQFEAGTSPLALFRRFRGPGYAFTGGPVFNMNNPNELSGFGFSAVWPLAVLKLLPGALFSQNKAWGMLTQLAKRAHSGRGMVGIMGVSMAGPTYFEVGPRQNAFAALFSIGGDFVPLSDLPQALRDGVERGLSFVGSLAGFGNDADAVAENADGYLGVIEGFN